MKPKKTKYNSTVIVDTKTLHKIFEGNIPDFDKGIAILRDNNIKCPNHIYLLALTEQENANQP